MKKNYFWFEVVSWPRWPNLGHLAGIASTNKYNMLLYVGFHCEEHDNPADYFLDVIIQCEQCSDHVSEVDLVASYQQSNQREETNKKLSIIMKELNAKEQAGVSIHQYASYATNIFWQVCRREEEARIICLVNF